jgi:hypothetical protein
LILEHLRLIPQNIYTVKLRFIRCCIRIAPIVNAKAMTEHFLSALTVKRLIRKARRISRQIDKSLEALHSGWSLASYNPNLLFDAFPCLQLRDGFRLASYQFVDGGNGNGFVFAIPTRHSLPEPPEDDFGFDWSESGNPVFCSEQPLPEWVHSNIESFLEGDGSPLSYFQASIFTRELREMGSLWHGCSWSTHEVLLSATQITKQQWKWQDEQPRDWQPVVRQNENGLWEVIFYSYTGLGQEQIVQNKDTFTKGYQFDVNGKTIALGEGGYVF